MDVELGSAESDNEETISLSLRSSSSVGSVEDEVIELPFSDGKNRDASANTYLYDALNKDFSDTFPSSGNCMKVPID